jgi:alanyl-tRNA synthetase
VAAGVRRIEAITNVAVETYYADQEAKLKSVNDLLKNPKDLSKAVEDLISKNNLLQKQVEGFKKEQAKLIKADLKTTIVSKGDFSFLESIIELDAGSVKDILFQLKGEIPNLFAVIGSKEDDKCAISVLIDENLVSSKGWNAGTLVKSVASLIQGGGGGQAFFATAGGKNAAGLTEAIEAIKQTIA